MREREREVCWSVCSWCYFVGSFRAFDAISSTKSMITTLTVATNDNDQDEK